MSKSSLFAILPLVSKAFVSGKLTEVTKFLVVDDKQEPVHSKFYDSEAEAQTIIDGLGNFAEGLAFARAVHPGMADKAQKAKAGVIAEYLTWLSADRPVTELNTEATATEAAAVVEGAVAAEPAVNAEEAF